MSEARAKRWVRLGLRWIPETPFRVGAGGPETLRDATGRPFVPGSALKGRVKHAARALYLRRHGRLCPGQAFAAGLAGAAPSEGCGCDLCLLFGAPGGPPAALAFSDLLPEGAVEAWFRWGAAVDRSRRSVVAARLFAREGAMAAALVGAVEGWLPMPEDGVDERVGLLWAALRLVRLGGGGGRGWGWGRMEVDAGELFPTGSPPEAWVAPWI